MNEQDLLSRLVDYHDHIAAPPVPVTEDLHRGRRRVRRNRGLLAGGVALGIASVVVGASLFTGDRSADRPQPVGPSPSRNDTTSDAALGTGGLTAPLVAPESILDVHELGFHLGPVPGFDPAGLGAGWSIDDEGQTIVLRWDEVGDEVTVNVGYQGGQAGLTLGEEDVTIHGVPGRYYESDHMVPGGFRAYLEWEYVPESWAMVQTSSDRENPGPERLRSALIEVAEAVAPGGESVGLPFRVEEVPSSLPRPASADEVGIRHGPNGVAAYAQIDNVQIEVNGQSHWSEDSPDCEPSDDVDAQTFTVRGNPGCLFWYSTTSEPPADTSLVDEVWLLVDATPRFIRPGFPDGSGPEYPVADMKQVLADLTVAPLDDTSTWFDLRTALSG
jgi:hypothetical protein